MIPTNSPSDFTQTTPLSTKKKSKATVITIILLTVLLLLTSAYGIFSYLKTSQLNNDLTAKNTEIATLTESNKSLKEKADRPAASTSITKKLPNGVTATFPNNDGNRNILFWSAGASEPTGLYVILSHTAIREFLSGLPSEKITPACGNQQELKAIIDNISVGILNTETKRLTPPQNGDCVAALASADNPDTELRAKAAGVISTVNSDIKAFIQSVQIK